VFAAPRRAVKRPDQIGFERSPLALVYDQIRDIRAGIAT
jgi:hypothetical protein